MKIKAKQVQILVIVLALALILFGSLNALFHLVPDSDLAGKISDGIFFSGIAAYFWSWKLRKKEAAEEAERVSGPESGGVDGANGTGGADGTGDGKAPGGSSD